MTTVTGREIPAKTNGALPRLNSPAVRAPARARVPITQRVGKISAGAGSITAGWRRWWGFTARPMSLRALWRLSTVDRQRIPGKSGALLILWHISNWTDRLAMFALILALPTGLTGPLRWAAQRPTRRVGLYLVIAALVAVYLIGRM
jgi:hypothetical protein